MWDRRRTGRGDEIDPGIGALGGKPHGDHQFVIFAIVQGAQGVGITLLQNVNDFSYFLLHSTPAFSFFAILSYEAENEKIFLHNPGAFGIR